MTDFFVIEFLQKLDWHASKLLSVALQIIPMIFMAGCQLKACWHDIAARSPNVYEVLRSLAKTT
jgi:hypothetical protein